jgi:hypothetical protein
VNVGWSLFNLLPMLPLDGGHLLDHGTAWLTGRREPARWVGIASVTVGGGVVLLSLRSGAPWRALIGAMGVAAGVARLRDERAVGFARTRASAGTRLGRWFRSRDLTERLADARVGRIPLDALAAVVAGAIRRGRHHELLSVCRDRLCGFARARDAAVLVRLASDALWDAGHAEDAIAVAQLAFEQLHAPDHAHDAACRLVELGQLDEAMEWVERAAHAAGERSDLLLDDPALDPLRDRADFARLAARRAGSDR